MLTVKPIFYTKFICLLVFPSMAFCQAEEQFLEFVPEGYTISEEVECGDLNKDSLDDYVLIIKGTNKEGFAENQFGKIVDRNRRGIIVLFRKNGCYESVIKNDDCFSSENEDGGAYFPPELSVDIKKGNLYVHYSHGKYGYWYYTFRYQNGDFELIGYDQTDHRGPVVISETCINFSTRKKRVRKNVNIQAEPGEEVFEETWLDIEINKLVKLSEIDDFDRLDF